MSVSVLCGSYETVTPLLVLSDFTIDNPRQILTPPPSVTYEVYAFPTAFDTNVGGKTTNETEESGEKIIPLLVKISETSSKYNPNQ